MKKPCEMTLTEEFLHALVGAGIVFLLVWALDALARAVGGGG